MPFRPLTMAGIKPVQAPTHRAPPPRPAMLRTRCPRRDRFVRITAQKRIAELIEAHQNLHQPGRPRMRAGRVPDMAHQPSTVLSAFRAATPAGPP